MLLASALLVALPGAAAPRFGLGLEGGAVGPLGATASGFSWGGSASARGQVHLVGPLWAQLGAGYASVGSLRPEEPQPGGALWLGGGARLTFFDGADDSRWGSAWVDAQANVVGTGPLARFGYEVGLGARLRVKPPYGVGPFARFLHIVDVPRPNAADAFLLVFGLAVTTASTQPERPAQPLAVADGGAGVADRDGRPDVPPAEPTTRIEIKTSAGGDRDGDGLADARDRCPDEAEIFNGADDEDGCPDDGEALVVLSPERLELRRPVRFEKSSGGWKVAAASLPMLSAAAMVLSLQPEVRSVRVVARSLPRAEAVRRALFDLGLDAGKLEALGEGRGEDVQLLLVR